MEKKQFAWKNVKKQRKGLERKKREIWEEKKRRVKRCMHGIIKEIILKERSGLSWNSKLLWKEVGKVKSGKMENCSRIKDGTWRQYVRNNK